MNITRELLEKDVIIAQLRLDNLILKQSLEDTISSPKGAINKNAARETQVRHTKFDPYNEDNIGIGITFNNGYHMSRDEWRSLSRRPDRIGVYLFWLKEKIDSGIPPEEAFSLRDINERLGPDGKLGPEDTRLIVTDVVYAYRKKYMNNPCEDVTTLGPKIGDPFDPSSGDFDPRIARLIGAI